MTTTLVPDACTSFSRLQTFHPFRRLPEELRRLIWEFSVPGGRIVQLQYTSYRPSIQFAPLPAFATLFSSTLPLNPRIVAQRTHRPLDFAAQYALTLLKNTGIVPVDFGTFHRSATPGRGPLRSGGELNDSEDRSTMPLFGIKAYGGNPGGLFACYESHLIYSKYYEPSTFGTLHPDHGIWFNFKLDTLFLDYEFADIYNDGWFELKTLGEDMQRIERLAICDRIPVQNYDPRTEPVAENDSELITDILLRFGPQVAELTYVTEHFASLGPDLAAAPFCDIDTLLREYSRPYEYIKEEPILQLIDSYDKVAHLMMNADMFALGSSTGIAGIEWSLPVVERHVFAEKSLVDRFNRAKSRYEEEKYTQIMTFFDEVCGPLWFTD